MGIDLNSEVSKDKIQMAEKPFKMYKIPSQKENSN